MHEFVTSDDVRLSFLDDGEGPPVVLVAGFRAPATSWVFQRRYLVERGYRVLSLDRRGHGPSDTPAWGARMARHGRDLAEFLTATTGGGPEAVVVGGSMGASTVWSMLDQGHEDPLRGIVGIDQTPKMSNEHGWTHGFYGYGAANLGTYFAEGAPPTGHGTPAAERGERQERMTRAFADPVGDPRPTVLTAVELTLLRDHAVQDWRDVVARTSVPALYVAGRDSELWPCEHPAATASLNPTAESLVIEDCGHVVNVEQPDAFNAALDEFIATLGAAARTGDSSGQAA